MNKDMIIVDKEIYLRRLKDIESDYRYLEKWYKEKEVYLAFEQRVLSYEKIKNKYYERTLDNTKVPVYIIPTDEEIMIARDTYNLCNQIGVICIKKYMKQ